MKLYDSGGLKDQTRQIQWWPEELLNVWELLCFIFCITWAEPLPWSNTDKPSIFHDNMLLESCLSQVTSITYPTIYKDRVPVQRINPTYPSRDQMVGGMAEAMYPSVNWIVNTHVTCFVVLEFWNLMRPYACFPMSTMRSRPAREDQPTIWPNVNQKLLHLTHPPPCHQCKQSSFCGACTSNVYVTVIRSFDVYTIDFNFAYQYINSRSPSYFTQNWTFSLIVQIAPLVVACVTLWVDFPELHDHDTQY